MKRFALPLAALCVGVGLALASAAGHADDARLFSGHIVPGAGMKQSDRMLAAATANRAARQVQLVKADATRIATGTDRLNLNIAPGRDLQVEKLRSRRNEDGTITWTGLVGGTAPIAARLKRFGGDELVEDQRNMVTLVRDGDLITGSIRVDNRLYTIEPVGNGNHAITEVDDSRIPADDPAEALPVIPMPVDRAAAEAAGPVQFRVLVVFTDRAADHTASLNGFAQSLVEEANRGYDGSQVRINLKLTSARRVPYQESNVGGVGTSASFGRDLDRIVAPNDGFMDQIHRIRNEENADVVVLVRRDGDICGKASGIGSTAATAFVTMARGCGPGYYTFHHEIGHLQGARHDPAQDPSSSPKAYAHGIIRPNAPEGGYRTVMAYACETGPECPRTPWVSNPNLFLNGVRMGSEDRQDNHRAMNESRNRIAGYR